MDRWADRGRIFLSIIFSCMVLTYVGERVIYHAVRGYGSILSTIIITVILLCMGLLIWHGYGWVRWLLGGYFLLNGLGTPTGIEIVFGPLLASLLALLVLVSHVTCALALCFTPGIRAFLRQQRAQRKARRAETASSA